jgi:hypothetical protein
MKLGAFSISLTVKDLAKLAFYGDLGFTRFGGADEHNYAIMKKWRHFAGLYQACLNVIC